MNSSNADLSTIAEEPASNEANAAGAAKNVDIEVDNASEENTNIVDGKDLIDYNDLEVAAAEEKEAKQLALREMLALNGFVLLCQNTSYGRVEITAPLVSAMVTG